LFSKTLYIYDIVLQRIMYIDVVMQVCCMNVFRFVCEQIIFLSKMAYLIWSIYSCKYLCF